ncbi:signal peptide peptidase SppA [Terrimonas sp. NA20]|uniref:Signal peptide peptidase SppA n=1 Tax=Terrimonas ginsenosidimutans TaxID=2908004 RepID=A0ABS9KY17_9BACT|nr:signal peptide peptidase SppA [Terrimonas ginsenosidimutans]MCG2617224.1 signal peptide peptidase SppA [Terrimonas ginsenosidimutans]
MRNFFKIFFACLLALVIFTIVAFFFFLAALGGLSKKERPVVTANSVLVLDLSQHFSEQLQRDPLGFFSSDNRDVPGLYDMVRLIREAKTDANIEGLYIIANGNSNSYAASEEIRNAIQDFKTARKFVIAHGDIITQNAYSVANIADKIYVSPAGMLDWSGYSVEYLFLKGTLDKLEIEPQIFYAGKFKSATEPLRSDRMTEANKLQTTVWLSDLYADLLMKTAEARKVDTATLHQLANDGTIQTAKDATEYKLVDGIKYDDEVKDEIKSHLNLGKYEKINFITASTYLAAGAIRDVKGEKIALIYAEGDIVDGRADQGTIGSENYRTLIRKARLDKSVKAIVFRVNSGGGSSLASENIWRELSLAKKEKPVVVSFGDVAASGGYYISCGADSIFALPTTITGSIGVFGIVPNLQNFFKNKAGITFDGVKTGPYADAGAAYRPLEENEKRMMQASVDLIYTQFKQRVSEGRKMDTAYVDSIAQGRVWTGRRAKEIGLIDRFGGLNDAIQCAGRMAKLESYRVSEYPEPQTFMEQIFGENRDPMNYAGKMKAEIGEDNYVIFQELKRVREMSKGTQARMPFRFVVR